MTLERGHRSPQLSFRGGRCPPMQVTAIKLLNYIHLNPVRAGLCKKSLWLRWRATPASKRLAQDLAND